MDEVMERDMVLLLADVSGYTRYMVENRRAALHSQGIITDLLRAVIQEVKLPLEVSKLEGDAVFMFAERKDGADWEDICRGLGHRLERFVEAFDAKLGELVGALDCSCSACTNLDKLRLKVVAHSGRAVRHTLGRFEELTGVDVILVHRLLKNQVHSHSYLLLTDAAFEALEPPTPELFQSAQLEDPDLGQIPLRVRLLEPTSLPAVQPRGLRAWLSTLAHGLRWRYHAWNSRGRRQG